VRRVPRSEAGFPAGGDLATAGSREPAVQRCRGNSERAGPNSRWLWCGTAGGGGAGGAGGAGAGARRAGGDGAGSGAMGRLRSGARAGGDGEREGADPVAPPPLLPPRGLLRAEAPFEGADPVALPPRPPLRRSAPARRARFSCARVAADGGVPNSAAGAVGAGGPSTSPGVAGSAAAGGRAGSSAEGGGSTARGARRGQASTSARQLRTTTVPATFLQRMRCSSGSPAMNHH